MKIKLDCPNGEYKETRIWCRAANNWCGNQRFKPCKGWWVLTDFAVKCPIKERSKK